MKIPSTPLGAALAAASLTTFVQAFARAPLDAVQGMADGHASITGPSGLAPALQRSHAAYDLQLTTTEGRRGADGPVLKLTISDSIGHSVFRLAGTEALAEERALCGAAGAARRRQDLRADEAAADGSFAFPGVPVAGTNYEVSVATQPLGQTCTLINASATVTASSQTAISVSCS